MGKQADAIADSAKDAFANMKMPPMPDGIDETFEDLWNALQTVVQNIPNVLIVVVFKLIEAVFKCFN